MPTITAILPQKRHENRRSIYLDGAFAFGCNLNVVAKFRLQQGQQLTAEQVAAIQQGEVRQECFDAAMRLLESRLHSRAELRKKLMRRQWGDAVVDAVLDHLQQLGYVDDARFAANRAASAVQTKHLGRRRAVAELVRSGVSNQVAATAAAQAYAQVNARELAHAVAVRQRARLLRLDPLVARRRLVGLLQRRGFDYDVIKPVVEQVLGRQDEAGE